MPPSKSSQKRDKSESIDKSADNINTCEDQKSRVKPIPLSIYNLTWKETLSGGRKSLFYIIGILCVVVTWYLQTISMKKTQEKNERADELQKKFLYYLSEIKIARSLSITLEGMPGKPDSATHRNNMIATQAEQCMAHCNLLATGQDMIFDAPLDDSLRINYKAEMDTINTHYYANNIIKINKDMIRLSAKTDKLNIFYQNQWFLAVDKISENKANQFTWYLLFYILGVLFLSVDKFKNFIIQERKNI